MATSAAGCAAMREHVAAARRYRDWRGKQPFGATDAYIYTYLGEDIVAALDGAADFLVWPLATVAPHVGVRTGGSRKQTVVSWPWSIPFGPEETCLLYGKTHYRGQKRHRALLEPGLLFGPEMGGFVRPGYRYLVHPEAGPVGLGAGLGTTLERMPGSPWRASLSPELLVHYGQCCSSGYLTVALRYDRFFAGRDRDMATVSLGLTFY